MVTNKLNGRTRPKSEALISLAVFELQKGQASTDALKNKKVRTSFNFICLIIKSY
jgi:hypothetical protein